MTVLRRLRALEKRSADFAESVTLRFADGSILQQSGRQGFILRLFRLSDSCSDASPEDLRVLNSIRQSTSSEESGNGHMCDLLRALLNSPCTPPDAAQDGTK